MFVNSREKDYICKKLLIMENNIGICITIPKSIKWEDYQKELDAVADWSQELNYKVNNLPTKVQKGDRCYLCYDGYIIGWMTITFIGQKKFRCTTTGKDWDYGNYISRSGPFHRLKQPTPCKGFRGFKYVNFGNMSESKKRIQNILSKYTNQEINECTINYAKQFHLSTFNNPLSYLMKEKLNESLIQTYPLDATVKYIRNYFNLKEDMVESHKTKTGEYIIVYMPNIDDNLEYMLKAMQYCGYYLASPKKEKVEKNKWVELQFEPVHNVPITHQIREEEKYLYHLTPSYNEGKIKNYGFIPKSKNDRFDYSDRIYLVRGSTPKKEIYNIGNQLNINNNSDRNTGEYILYTIDLSKLPEHIKLFIDPNYDYGVYTTDNIPISSIINQTKIQF